MFSNFIKITFRNLFKKKVFSVINIAGLALGMAACISIFYYVGYEFSYEKSFNESENIYRVYLKRIQEDRTRGYFYLPGPVKEGLTEEQTVESTFRLLTIDYQNNSLIYEDDVDKKVFEQQNINYTDKEIETTLGLNVISGSFNHMNEPFKMVLSQSVANKFFSNTEEAIGKTLTISGNIGSHSYEVIAVTEDLPGNTHFEFEVLLSINSIDKVEGSPTVEKWDQWNCRTYVKSFSDRSEIENTVMRVLEQSPFEKEEGSTWQSFAWPIEEMHLANVGDDGSIDRAPEKMLWGLIGIGVFILVLAWTNFVNLSTSRALERAREVGVRKVLGSQKTQLRVQFILESFLINCISLVLAFTLVQLTLPFLKELTNPMILTMEQTVVFWISIMSIIILGSLLSGLYPAFVLSNFKPVYVLKGKLSSRQGSGSILRKGLVTFQFIASAVMIIGTFIIYQQITFMKNKSLGMNIDNMLIVESPPRVIGSNDNSNEIFINSANQLNSVESVTGSSYAPGESIGWNTVFKKLNESNDQLKNLYLIACDRNFKETYGLELIAGRFYNESDRTFGKGNIVINEKAVGFLGFTSPENAIGQKLTDNGMFSEVEIIGVVNNFHQQSLQYQIAPCALVKSVWYNYFSIALNLDKSKPYGEQLAQIDNNLEEIEEVWAKAFPEAPFDYTFLDEKFDKQYKSDQQFGTIILLFAVVSISIAILGLLGLSAYSVNQRTKEIGIRKVLGSSIAKIFLLLSKEYMRLILLASIIAIPLAIWLMDKWLADYPYRIDIELYMLIIPIVMVVIVALITVASQVIRAATKNPVESLRYE